MPTPSAEPSDIWVEHGSHVRLEKKGDGLRGKERGLDAPSTGFASSRSFLCSESESAGVEEREETT